jgi:protein subunit release factor A
MAALSESRLRQMIDRFDQVEARMGVATDPKEIVQLSRDHAELKRIAEKAREVLMLRAQLAEAEALIEDDDRRPRLRQHGDRGTRRDQGKAPGHRARDAADAAAQGSRR